LPRLEFNQKFFEVETPALIPAKLAWFPLSVAGNSEWESLSYSVCNVTWIWQNHTSVHSLG